MPPRFGGAFSKPAPATADFQNPLTAAKPVQDTVIFAVLGAIEIAVVFLVERR